MSEEKTNQNNPSRALGEAIRNMRRRYDQLARGQTAPIRRCRTADEVALEGIYWRIGDALAHQNKHLPHVVLLFPLVSHKPNDGFSFGRYLRTQISSGDTAQLRFRRLLDSRDRDELDHRLRGLLKLAASGGAPVDWGVLGTDILWFFAESDRVRRRWAQDFYAPTFTEASSTASGASSTSSV